MHPLAHAAFGIVVGIPIAIVIMNKCKVSLYIQFGELPVIAIMCGVIAALPDAWAIWGQPDIDHEWWAQLCFLHKMFDEIHTTIEFQHFLIVAAICVFIFYECFLMAFIRANETLINP